MNKYRAFRAFDLSLLDEWVVFFVAFQNLTQDISDQRMFLGLKKDKAGDL